MSASRSQQAVFAKSGIDPSRKNQKNESKRKGTPIVGLKRLERAQPGPAKKRRYNPMAKAATKTQAKTKSQAKGSKSNATNSNKPQAAENQGVEIQHIPLNLQGLIWDISIEPYEVRKAMLEQRTPLSMINGFNLRRSLVMGQARLELVGADANSLEEFKMFGCFIEVIQWKTRLFVPIDNMDVLTGILDKYPIGRNCEEAA